MTFSPGREGVTGSLIQSNVPTIYVAVAVSMDFEGGIVRLSSLKGTKIFEGEIYDGLGALGTINQAKETNDLAANGIELILTGVPDEYKSLALNEIYRGRPVTCYLWILDTDLNIIQSTITFKGLMDQMIISSDGTTATVTVRCENRLIELNRTRDSRYTQEEQKLLWNDTDQGLRFVASLALKNIYWGSAAPGAAPIQTSYAGGGFNKGRIPVAAN